MRGTLRALLNPGWRPAVLTAVVAGAVALASPIGTSAPSASPTMAAPQQIGASAALAERLNAILDDPRYDGAHVGLVVRSAATGEVLYARNPGEGLSPASNTKLFSSAAGLESLGAGYRFRTSVLSDGGRDGSTLTGNLYLRGGGDPTLLARDLHALAARLAASGVKSINGDLVADDTFFDRARLGTSWSWDYEESYYAAQISGLTLAPNTDYDAGTVIVSVRPGSAVGDPAQVQLKPATGYVRVVNLAKTGATSSSDTVSVVRQHGRNVVRVTGSIPARSAPDIEWVTVWEPTGYAADVFARALSRKGIDVRGRIRYAATPGGARTLARHESMTLGKVYVPFLKLSNNMHAEALVKTVAAEATGQGTWSGGLALMLQDLRGLDVQTERMAMVDGSGLSRRDLIVPAQVTRLLLAARSQPWFDTWYRALPVAGAERRLVGGTLRSRMNGTAAAHNMHAKTGSLTGVSALSGYVRDADGELLVFSMISNNYLASSVKDIEDAVGITLARFSRNPAVLLRTPYVESERPAHPARADVECSWVKLC